MPSSLELSLELSGPSEQDQAREEHLTTLVDWGGIESEQAKISHLQYSIKVLERRQEQLETEIRQLKKEAVEVRAKEQERLMTLSTKQMHLDKGKNF